MRIRTLLFWLLLVATLALLSGCTHLVESGRMDAGPEHASCSDGGVAYHLPRRKVEIKVYRYDNSGVDFYTLEISDQLKPAGYGDARFCLRYLSSSFSTDYIGVKVSEEGLLQKVYTKAEDQAGDITVKLAQAIVDNIAGQRADTARFLKSADDKSEGGIVQVGTFVVDPFDQVAMKQVNRTLREYGYCVHLDDSNDPYIPPWASAQCEQDPIITGPEFAGNRPITPDTPVTAAKTPLWQDSLVPLLPDDNEGVNLGILYRPNLTHRLRVLTRPDPNLTSSWTLDQLRAVEMPNAAPVFSIDVRRAFLADRTTTLDFSNGVLDDVTITKGSEFDALVDIPLSIAQFVVSLPAQVLQLKFNRTSNAKEIIAANEKLLATYLLLEQQQAEQETLQRDAEVCKTAASIFGGNLSAERIADNLHRCVKALKQCRESEMSPKNPPEQCAKDFWSEVQRTQGGTT